MSSSCVPSSTTRPCSSTQMRSACRTVEKRWEMRIVVQRQLEADEVLKDGGDAGAPRPEVKMAKVDAVDFDGPRLRVVEAAQQLGERRLSGSVLADDRDRRPGGDGEFEMLEHRRAAR